MAVRRNAAFQTQYFLASLHPISQFVLRVQEIICLLFSSLCQLRAKNYLLSFPLLLLLHPYSSSSSSQLLLLKGYLLQRTGVTCGWKGSNAPPIFVMVKNVLCLLFEGRQMKKETCKGLNNNKNIASQRQHNSLHRTVRPRTFTL